MQSKKKHLMIYGANGYSAQLIIEELIARNIKPILAGRNKKAIAKVAEKFSCQYNIFDLTEEVKALEALKNIHTVIHCAGPYKYTAKEMIDLCLASKTNYLDITGEMPSLAYAFGCSKKAKEEGIVILPSVGFDVIPTDCLAKMLKEEMPDAKFLKLGFYNKGGGISRGTSLTSLEFTGGSGKVRMDGQIIDSPIGEYSLKIEKKAFQFYGISIPWGDVFTSFISTGIPNIEVYFGLSKFLFKVRHLLFIITRIFEIEFVKKLMSSYIKHFFSGPNKNQRDKTQTYIYGSVSNEKGVLIEKVFQVMEGYNLTAKGAVESAIRVLNNEVKPGTHTPSLAFGSDYLNQVVIRKIYD